MAIISDLTNSGPKRRIKISNISSENELKKITALLEKNNFVTKSTDDSANGDNYYHPPKKEEDGETWSITVVGKSTVLDVLRDKLQGEGLIKEQGLFDIQEVTQNMKTTRKESEILDLTESHLTLFKPILNVCGFSESSDQLNKAFQNYYTINGTDIKIHGSVKCVNELSEERTKPLRTLSEQQVQECIDEGIIDKIQSFNNEIKSSNDIKEKLDKIVGAINELIRKPTAQLTDAERPEKTKQLTP